MEENSSSSAELKKPHKFNKFWILTIAVVALLAVPAFYFYSKYQQTNNQLQNSGSPAGAAQELIGQVGKLIQLPTNEQPTIATVSDVNQLPNQPLFAGAQNGDKVLIYRIAGEGVLYRPSTNKVINVVPISFIQSDTAATSSGTLTATSSAVQTITPSIIP